MDDALLSWEHSHAYLRLGFIAGAVDNTACTAVRAFMVPLLASLTSLSLVLD